MMAHAFSSVQFPVLPVIQKDEAGELKFFKRNARLYTPSDFDYSPYFDIIKYPFLGLDDLGVYRQLPWNEEGIVCNSPDDCYVPVYAQNKQQETTDTESVSNQSSIDNDDNPIIEGKT
jgi:hypothetical protein